VLAFGRQFHHLLALLASALSRAGREFTSLEFLMCLWPCHSHAIFSSAMAKPESVDVRLLM